MKLREFGFWILVPSLVLAGHFGGDTVFKQANSRTSWKVDGANVRFFDPESLCLCERRTQWNLRLLPTDSVKVQNPKPADTTSVFTIQRPNPMSQKMVDHRLWFHDSLWWKVRGRTGWWAMESELLAYQMKNYYTDTLAYRFRWSRIDPKRQWVQWLDSIQHTGKESGIVDSQKTHLLRCLADTGCAIDTLFGKLASDNNNLIRSLNASLRFGIGIQTDNGWDTLWLTRNPDGSIARSGRSHRFRTTNSASLAIAPLFSWSGSYRHGSFPHGWLQVRASWHFRVSGVMDSIVQTGWVPQIAESIHKGPPHSTPAPSHHAKDIHGGAVELVEPRPSGIHLVRQNGRWTTVIVAP